MNKKEMFVKAHELTKEIKKEFPEVDYKFQFALCLAYFQEGGYEMSERTSEISKDLGITEDEAVELENVEKAVNAYYHDNYKLDFNLWEKGGKRRVYFKTQSRCKNANAKGNYYDLIEKRLYDRYVRM